MRMEKLNARLKMILAAVFTIVILQSFYAPNSVLWTVKAGVTIPSNQEFVLGEYKHPDYRSVIENKSEADILIELRDRNSNDITNSLELDAGESVKVDVTKDEMVILKNSSDKEVLIKVKASRNVSGMRYQELGAYED